MTENFYFEIFILSKAKIKTLQFDYFFHFSHNGKQKNSMPRLPLAPLIQH